MGKILCGLHSPPAVVKASASGHGRRDISWALLAEQLAIELSQTFAASLNGPLSSDRRTKNASPAAVMTPALS